MAWNDVSSEIAIDKVVRASTHQKIMDNFAALAGGDPGAPKVQIPAAVGTSELDPSKVLKPNGSGGVQWASISAGLTGGNHVNLSNSNQTTNVPASVLIYVIGGNAVTFATYTIVVPNPSAALAGHILILNISLANGSTARVRQGSSGGTTIVSVTAPGFGSSSLNTIVFCDGAHWHTQ